MTQLTTIEILKGARDLIAEGWTQNAFSAETSVGRCYCAEGALKAAAGIQDMGATGGPLTYGAVQALQPFITGTASDPVGAIWAWNDASWRTQEEVLVAFGQAISAEEKRVAA